MFQFNENPNLPLNCCRVCVKQFEDFTKMKAEIKKNYWFLLNTLQCNGFETEKIVVDTIKEEPDDNADSEYNTFYEEINPIPPSIFIKDEIVSMDYDKSHENSTTERSKRLKRRSVRKK